MPKPVIDRSEEMIEKRVRPFGGRSIPHSNTFGITKESYKGFVTGMQIFYIVFGEWTKNDILFLLENKTNPICPKGDGQTAVFCPHEREGELVEILKIKYKKLTFGETKSGNPYIAVDEMRHILFTEPNKEDGWHFLMHYK